MKIKITKLVDTQFNGEHPNGINTGYEKIGYSKNLPKVGESFQLNTLSSWFYTSVVTKVTKGTFTTQNSKYKFEVLEDD